MGEKLEKTLMDSFHKTAGTKPKMKKASTKVNMDAPKTHKAKSSIGHEYKDDPKRPRA